MRKPTTKPPQPAVLGLLHTCRGGRRPAPPPSPAALRALPDLPGLLRLGRLLLRNPLALLVQRRLLFLRLVLRRLVASVLCFPRPLAGLVGGFPVFVDLPLELLGLLVQLLQLLLLGLVLRRQLLITVLVLRRGGSGCRV